MAVMRDKTRLILVNSSEIRKKLTVKQKIYGKNKKMLMHMSAFRQKIRINSSPVA